MKKEGEGDSAIDCVIAPKERVMPCGFVCVCVYMGMGIQFGFVWFQCGSLLDGWERWMDGGWERWMALNDDDGGDDDGDGDGDDGDGDERFGPPRPTGVSGWISTHTGKEDEEDDDEGASALWVWFGGG